MPIWVILFGDLHHDGLLDLSIAICEGSTAAASVEARRGSASGLQGCAVAPAARGRSSVRVLVRHTRGVPGPILRESRLLGCAVAVRTCGP